MTITTITTKDPTNDDDDIRDDDDDNFEHDDTDRAFLKWFEDNGGWLNPKLGYGTVSDELGKGLYVRRARSSITENDDRSKEEEQDNHDDDGAVVEEDELLMKIPDALVFDPVRVQKRLQSILDNDEEEEEDEEDEQQSHRPIQLGPILNEIDRNYGDSLFGSSNMILVLGLQWELSLGEESFYHPFLETLPLHVGLPSNFTDAELKLFQNKGELWQQRYARQGHHTLWYKTFQPVIQAFQRRQRQQGSATILEKETNPSAWSFATFVRCYQLVTTRFLTFRNNHPMDGVNEDNDDFDPWANATKILPPMADKINHAPLKNNKSLDKMKRLLHHVREEGVAYVYSNGKFRPGGIIFEDYGNLWNQRFVKDGGFVPFKNPYHHVEIPLPSLKDPRVEWIAQTLNLPLQMDHSYASSVTEVVDRNAGVIGTTWKYLELVPLHQYPTKLSKVEFALQVNDQKAFCTELPVLCDPNATAGSANPTSQRFIQDGARQALKRFPTTLEEDRRLLAEWIRRKPFSTNDDGTILREHAIMAIQCRMVDKEYYHRMIATEIPYDGLQDLHGNSLYGVAIAIVILTSIWFSNRR